MAADDFMPVPVLDVQSVTGSTNSDTSPTLTSCAPVQVADPYMAITVLLAGKKYTGRTMIGAGGIYVSNHPEEVAVGSTIDARDAGHGFIELRIGATQRIVKLKVLRVEIVAPKEDAK
jgi:hypothetical protein